MEPEKKNLHAALPPALLAEVKSAAQAERITVDEFLRDAVQRRLNSRDWHDLLAFGKSHAQSRGLKEDDVAEAITNVRRESEERR